MPSAECRRSRLYSSIQAATRARAWAAAGVKAGRRPPEGLGLDVGEDGARLTSGGSRSRRISGRLRRWVLAQGAFVVQWAAHAQCGVPPVAVVLLDPGRDPGPGLGRGRGQGWP